jgi:3-methyladenine DNA glycosylase AlkD
MEIDSLKRELQGLQNTERAKHSQRYFKTGKGEYAEGDIFLGLTSKQIGDIAKKYQKNFSLNEVQELLNSKIHEYRVCALRVLIHKYKKAKKDRLEKRRIYEFYLKNTKNINNWDLVDISASHIVGDFVKREGTEILMRLAKSENLWERRISILSTFPFIKKNQFGETLAISELLMNDKHDLIHKAVGWGLREVGKKNQKVLELFLMQRYKQMPRTMLRYSIEKFPEEKRKAYLKGEV